MGRYRLRDGLRNGRLPDGVPADNKEKPDARASFASPDFAAPDMATPRFTKEPARGPGGASAAQPLSVQPPPAAPPLSLGAAQAAEDAPAASTARKGEAASRRFPLSPGQTVLFAAILILLGALGAGVMLNGGGTPLCADQPDWNQYNCRAF